MIGIGQAEPSVGTMNLLREQIADMTTLRADAWAKGYSAAQLASVDHHLAELRRTLALFSSQFKAIPAEAISDVTWAMGEALSAMRDLSDQEPAGPPRGGALQAGVGGLGLLLSLGFMLFRGRRRSNPRHHANPRHRRRRRN